MRVSRRVPRCAIRPRRMPSGWKPRLRATAQDASFPTMPCHSTRSAPRSSNAPSKRAERVGLVTRPALRVPLLDELERVAEAERLGSSRPLHDLRVLTCLHERFSITAVESAQCEVFRDEGHWLHGFHPS
jgi:hypothetical protein